MLKKLLLVIAIGVGIGILIWPFFTQAEAAWSRLPSILKAIIPVTIGAIPTILMIFFAWSKNRAMQLTEQTKLQASQQRTQMKGEYDKKLAVLTKQNQTLQRQVGAGTSELATKISQQTDTITKQAQTISNLKERLNEAEGLAHITMHPTEAEQIQILQKAGYTITKTVH